MVATEEFQEVEQTRREIDLSHQVGDTHKQGLETLIQVYMKGQYVQKREKQEYRQ